MDPPDDHRPRQDVRRWTRLTTTPARRPPPRAGGARRVSSPIAYVLDFFAEYRVPLLILSAVAVLGSMAMDRRRGRGELEAIRELDEEFAEDA